MANEEKKYVISEDGLRTLLKRSLKLAVLESDGVDNWEWYMESRDEVIADFLSIEPEEVRLNDYDFDTVVDDLLRRGYSIVEEHIKKV